MFIFMRQADTLYEIRKYELERLDHDRIKEDVIFYVLPIDPPPEGLPSIEIKAENRGSFAITIERVWLNDSSNEVGHPVPSMSTEIIGTFDVPDENKSYIIKLVTDRGNFVPSISGVPTYDTNFGWKMDSFTIYIMMTDPSSQLHILVNNTHTESNPIDPPVTYFDNDVENNKPGYIISVPLPGKYYVKVTRWHGTPSQQVLYQTTEGNELELGLTRTWGLIII